MGGSLLAAEGVIRCCVQDQICCAQTRAAALERAGHGILSQLTDFACRQMGKWIDQAQSRSFEFAEPEVGDGPAGDRAGEIDRLRTCRHRDLKLPETRVKRLRDPPRIVGGGNVHNDHKVSICNRQRWLRTRLEEGRRP